MTAIKMEVDGNFEFDLTLTWIEKKTQIRNGSCIPEYSLKYVVYIILRQVAGKLIFQMTSWTYADYEACLKLSFWQQR